MTKSLLRNSIGFHSGAAQLDRKNNENQSNVNNFETNAGRNVSVRTEFHSTGKHIHSLSITPLIIVVGLLMMISTGCNKLRNDLLHDFPEDGGKVVKNYMQKNLVSDTSGFNAARLDTTLSNAWGISINPTGIFWINANGKSVSEVYDLNGVAKRAPVKVPFPSGIVFNTTTDFMISATNEASRFIFASENGKIYAWASGDSARTVVDRSGAMAVYKGLELANDGTGNFLFATDFHNGKVDVFDKNFNLVTTKPFSDAMIPMGFAPFNVRLLDSVLFVTYAKQLAPDNHDDDKGPGNGYVDVFKTDGSLLRRFASKGKLNSPWGIEKAPVGFGQGKNVILIGNFGDGRINVYDEREGEFVRHLSSYGSSIKIDGLWAITFPDGRVPGDNPNKLYFSAGPNDESHGIFGYILNQ